MKLYKTKSGIVIERNGKFYHLGEQNWNSFLNDDHLHDKMEKLASSMKPSAYAEVLVERDLLAPIQDQEVWGSGITYISTMENRRDEGETSGDFYAKLYHAERPELYLKATPGRTVGSKDFINIRKDSTWDFAEPELTAFATSSGKIVGYTVGNDVCSRSIEGENPIYLPQSKIYERCASIGPGILVTETPLPKDTIIHILISRSGKSVFDEKVGINKMKREPQDLINWLFKECAFPHGVFLLTGTGITPGKDFTLKSADKVEITIDHIGTLINYVN